jgi:hypothetical protein
VLICGVSELHETSMLLEVEDTMAKVAGVDLPMARWLRRRQWCTEGSLQSWVAKGEGSVMLTTH